MMKLLLADFTTNNNINGHNYDESFHYLGNKKIEHLEKNQNKKRKQKLATHHLRKI